ncbi:hypothetical protein PhCBS80983_g04838 [Powellomyces hirtus]|uniref:Uncharacterized protein n=1 Tax=Powellomyces hirtus TaxID=109895 RepID=A0A507DX53_9FUNG|nr:hypothetical protein PhCBS80983_g04838 [Powellomyces hirtus]
MTEAATEAETADVGPDLRIVTGRETVGRDHLLAVDGLDPGREVDLLDGTVDVGTGRDRAPLGETATPTKWSRLWNAEEALVPAPDLHPAKQKGMMGNR